MKTKEQLQAAVNELRDVCKKHNVVLIGTCYSEQIFGEITIGCVEEVDQQWENVEFALDNTVREYDTGYFCLGGIGEYAPASPSV